MVTLLCLLPGPSWVYRTEVDDRERWCFGCRHRHIHAIQLLGDPPHVMSWYDSVVVLLCPCCGKDCTEFGTTR